MTDLKVAELKKLNRHANLGYLGASGTFVIFVFQFHNVYNSFHKFEEEGDKEPRINDYIINLPEWELVENLTDDGQPINPDNYIIVEMAENRQSTVESITIRFRKIAEEIIRNGVDKNMYYNGWITMLLGATGFYSKSIYMLKMMHKVRFAIRFTLFSVFTSLIIAPPLLYMYYIYMNVSKINMEQIDRVISNVKVVKFGELRSENANKNQ